MKNGEKKGRTLKREAFSAIFVAMFILLFVTILICLRYYVYTVIKSYNTELEDLARFSVSQLDMDYVEEIFEITQNIYDSMPEDVKQDPFSEEFKDYFRPYLGEKYKSSRKILFDCRENTTILNIYMGFYDQENTRFVMVLDGDVSGIYYIPGQYIANTENNLASWEEVRWIMDSDWFLSFKHADFVGFTATDYIPLYGKDGREIGILAIDTLVQELIDDLQIFLGLLLPSLILSFLILYLLISRVIDKRVIKPIDLLDQAARTYTARDKVNESENTSLFANVNMKKENELSRLRDTMADMEKDIYESIKEIRRVSADKERMAAELDIAAGIQQSALPKSFPTDASFDLYAVMHPAKEVAGDFYDFFMIDDDHMALVMADVSGKGIPAALFMMKGKEILKNAAAHIQKPSQILGYANNLLAEDNEGMMFITIWLGILEISTGIVTASNAGHEYPFLADAEGVFTMLKDAHGMVCGAMPDMDYKDYTFTLPKGGGIFLYTDGIAEATNAKDEAFGLERIEESLNEHKGESAQEHIEAMKKDIDAFVAGEEQFDDITMMCLLFK